MSDHRVIFGDAIEALKTLDAESVDCVVTSPPYWGLRDYGGWRMYTRWHPDGVLEGAFPGGRRTRRRGSRRREIDLKMRAERRGGLQCPRTGVRMDALGLERTPDIYVAHLVAVFREVRRVLKPEGCAFLNLGDSFASGKGTCYNPGGGDNSLGQGRKAAGVHPLDRGSVSSLREQGLKPKDLVGIPWRVAFALQADGWWLRNDICWLKTNAMPESVTDRFSSKHEYVFLLAKSAKYWFDLDAVREPHSRDWSQEAWAQHNRRDDLKDNALMTTHDGEKTLAETFNPLGKNPGDVWSIPTRPFSGAHFATFPPALVERCLLAGCPPKICSKCGRAWEYRIEKSGLINHPARENCNVPARQFNANDNEYADGGTLGKVHIVEDLGYHPTCECNASPMPGLVLDPFVGSGTTIQVARKLQRRSVGIEMNPAYEAVMRKRLGVPQNALFEDVTFE